MNNDKLQKIIEKLTLESGAMQALPLSAALVNFAGIIERETMIRCVKMIDDNAKEHFMKNINSAQSTEGDTEVIELKVTCVDMKHGASPLLGELSMTFPACQEHYNA